jgi:hypothetical protein
MGSLIDPPEERIGWLRMLIDVWRRAGEATYADLIADAERLIADCQRELRKGRRADVRQRP